MPGKTKIIQKKEKNKTDHNSNQDMLIIAQDIFITTREVKTHTHGLKIVMNS